MSRFLVKYSDNKIYIIEDKDFSFQSLIKRLKKNGFKVVTFNDAEKFIEKISKKNIDKGENYLIIVTENQPCTEITDHFKHLNLTVEWLLTILNKFSIGFYIFNQKNILAYNNIFQRISHSTYQTIQKTEPDFFINFNDREVFQQKTEKCLNKEINSFTMEIKLMEDNKSMFFGYPITIEGRSLVAGYFLNQEDHDLNDTETIRSHKLIINELNQAFKQLSKIQGLDKIKTSTKEQIISELSEDQPDYGSLNLSDREYEVLMLIYKGYTNQQIADELYISKRTVDFHRSNLLGKTNSRNTADLIRFALKNNLIHD
jgi:FixJ family two-component response regulator